MKKKFVLDLTGFEPGTLGLWDLYATKELRRLPVIDDDFIWYLRKQLVFRRFFALLTSQS